MVERRNVRRLSATIAVTEGLLPPAIERVLTVRGFHLASLTLTRPGKTRIDQRAADRRPPVAIIGAEALASSADEARAAVARLKEAGSPVIVVGRVFQDIANVVSEEADAWLPDLEELPLLTAIRSALSLITTRGELQRTRDELTLRESEAQSLYEVGTALTTERDINRLQELILRRCRELTSADAGSLYLVDEDAEKRPILRFENSQNDSVESSYQRFTIPISDQSIAGYVALTGEPLNLEDVYELPADAPYKFNRGFDERMGYRTRSMLVVPLRNHESDVIGVIQLINRKRSFEAKLHAPEDFRRQVRPFPHGAEQVLDSFASQAAIALDNRLLLESIENLFEGFVRASITAIEARDPTTSGHSERVAELTVGIAQSVNSIGVGQWKDVYFSDLALREVRYAGLLHDFGKIGVREAILVKAKKLHDYQLELITLRFAFVRKAMEAEHNRKQLAIALEEGRDAFIAALGPLDGDYQRRVRALDADLTAILSANEPTVLDQDTFGRLVDIKTRLYLDPEGTQKLMLEEPELLALSVKRGSLTEPERKEIESHVSHTFKFLSLMPWTRQLKNVPLIAGAHHEKLDGTGYPWGLKSQEIPIQSKMMTISDIYDALTASDRPYKRAVPTDKALDILHMEKDAGHIDADLLDVFIHRRVYDIAVEVTLRQAMAAVSSI
jgi:HD-GYP domain-containing protein (c-di-GMP phosphodiesterase class II)